VLSDKYSEGQTKDISEGFPSDADPHTDYYGYLSDSDLEVESSCSEDEEKPSEEEDTKEPAEGDKPGSPRNATDPDSRVPLRKTPGNLPQSSQVAAGTQDDHRLVPNSVKFPEPFLTSVADLTEAQPGWGRLQ